MIASLAVAACSTPPRAPASFCMQRTLDSLNLAGIGNDRQHCVASGSIALRCGTASAWLAGYGKELADMVGPGSFQRRDLQANAAGRECADRSPVEQELGACCAESGF